MTKRRAAVTAPRLGRFIAVLAMLAGGFAVIVLSPYLLEWLAAGPQDWTDAANLGQAYGAVSAVLSALALAGVAVSLYFQRKQVTAAWAYGDRERHHELLRMAFDSPELLRAFDADLAEAPDARAIMFANMWMGFWRNSWLHGGTSDQMLANMTKAMFRNPIPWIWWRDHGETWAETNNRKGKQFARIVWQSWVAVSPEGPSAAKVPQQRRPTATRDRAYPAS